jgi:hypothetical protein
MYKGVTNLVLVLLERKRYSRFKCYVKETFSTTETVWIPENHRVYGLCPGCVSVFV